MKQSTAPERRPQTLKERRAQLLRIADALLYRIEHGQLNASERAQAIRSYGDIERTLEGMDKRIHEDEVSALLLWSELKVEAEEAEELEAEELL